MKKLFKIIGVAISSAGLVVAGLYYLGKRRARRNEVKEEVEGQEVHSANNVQTPSKDEKVTA